MIKTHLGKKELDRQAISKIANIITLLIKEDRSQKQLAKKQNCTAVQNHKTTNQSNDLYEYENTNK